MGSVYYLAFGYSDKWYNRWLKGYTHVALILHVDGGYVGLEPLLKRCAISCGMDIRLDEWDEILKIKVTPTKANRLIGLRFQTCATFVQYVMGISTGAILCQTLYDRLTTREYQGVKVDKRN